MPPARISIATTASAATVRALSGVVYDAMIEVANVPANDVVREDWPFGDGEMPYAPKA